MYIIYMLWTYYSILLVSGNFFVSQETAWKVSGCQCNCFRYTEWQQMRKASRFVDQHFYIHSCFLINSCLKEMNRVISRYKWKIYFEKYILYHYLSPKYKLIIHELQALTQHFKKTLNKGDIVICYNGG